MMMMMMMMMAAWWSTDHHTDRPTDRPTTCPTDHLSDRPAITETDARDRRVGDDRHGATLTDDGERAREVDRRRELIG